MPTMYPGHILSGLKFSVDMERSNSPLSQEIGKNIGMHDLWRVVAVSPSVNTLNSILLKVLFCLQH